MSHRSPMGSGSPHGAGGYVRGCRCEVCVGERNVYNREWMRRYRHGPLPEVAVGECLECGESLLSHPLERRCFIREMV